MTDAPGPVRLRIAPSPTGDPHIGTAYVALFNMAFAHRYGGQFVLRIEDTDRSRYVDTSEQLIFDSLRWLDICWDEGPDVDGPYGPYRQSERRGTYTQYAEQLIGSGHAYRCWCSPERLARVRKEMEARKEPPRYDRLCLGKSESERRALGDTSERPVVRMLMPNEGTTGFDDLIRGRIEFENRLLDDQVLLKSDGFPTYHLAVVVDDHLMAISHVARGEEWISSTPKHVLLYEWLGFPLPRFAHFPLLRNENRSKVSKRKNPWATLLWFRENGFLPEALINFLALLGWSMPDGREVFGLQDIVENFSFDRVSTTGPIFDLNKLDWLNGHYIRQLSLAELASRVRPFLENAGIEADDPALERALPLVQERLKRLAEAPELLGFLYERHGAYDARQLVPKGLDAAVVGNLLADAETLIREVPSFDHAALEAAFRQLTADRGVKTGPAFMCLRVAVTFSTVSPPLFETMEVLGQERVRERIEQARSRVGG
ncbi:MAG: glutamate--tRNA ligase [Chloroflexi bacterium]|nr:glutamate--tRNA ligase [Chloroflexota bacterium]